MTIFLLIVAFVINLVLCFKFASIAEEKGHEPKGYFWWCFFLGTAGYIMVAALPDRGYYASSMKNTNGDSGKKPTTDLAYEERLLSNGGWKCPSCQKVNPESVTTCRCGMTKC